MRRVEWITQEVISIMDERRKWKNFNKEGQKNHRLKNKLKRATDEAKKEYLERICDEFIKFQRTGRDLIYRRRGNMWER